MGFGIRSGTCIGLKPICEGQLDERMDGRSPPVEPGAECLDFTAPDLRDVECITNTMVYCSDN